MKIYRNLKARAIRAALSLYTHEAGAEITEYMIAVVALGVLGFAAYHFAGSLISSKVVGFVQCVTGNGSSC